MRESFTACNIVDLIIFVNDRPQYQRLFKLPKPCRLAILKQLAHHLRPNFIEVIGFTSDHFNDAVVSHAQFDVFWIWFAEDYAEVLVGVVSRGYDGNGHFHLCLAVGEIDINRFNIDLSSWVTIFVMWIIGTTFNS